MSDNCKSNENVECAIKRLMIMMKIKMKMKEINKMNIRSGKENHQCCMWVRDRSLVNRGDYERQRELQNV